MSRGDKTKMLWLNKEYRESMIRKHKGKTSGFKNKKHTKGAIEKMKEKRKYQTPCLGKHWKIPEEALQKRKGKPGNNKGKHWKIKDTSKMKGNKNALGHTCTVEAKKRMGHDSKGEKNGMFSKHHTKESKEKNRLKHINKKSTEKTKRKLKEWAINHPNRKFSNTKIEQKIAIELTKRGIYFQQNVGLCNVANVDFYLPEYRIVIECDGCYYHNCLIHYPEYHKDTGEADERKTKILTYNGFNVYRFWEHDINKSAEDCVNRLSLKI